MMGEIRIRPEQIAALDKAAEEKWRADLASHLRQQFPEESGRFSDKDLDALVARAVERAEGYGIDQSQPLAQFVVLSLTLGESFDDDADIRNYLEDAVMDPEDKMNALLDAIEASD